MANKAAHAAVLFLATHRAELVERSIWQQSASLALLVLPLVS
jgi:hypothetical protein